MSSQKSLLSISKELIKWWIIDYEESLVLRLAGWSKLSAMPSSVLLDKRLPGYVKSMYYVIDLADKLISRNYRVLYANFSHLEFRNGMHGGWPDLVIGKNCKTGLIEVKGEMTFAEALSKIVGRNASLRTNFFNPKGANYVKLAKDLGIFLFLAYFDTQAKDYRIIPVITSLKCSKEKKAIDINSIVEEFKERKGRREKLFKEVQEKVKAITLDELDEFFK